MPTDDYSQQLRNREKRRLEENKRLRQRVAELEDAVFSLSREVYFLRSYFTNLRIEDYLNNYQPKNKSTNEQL